MKMVMIKEDSGQFSVGEMAGAEVGMGGQGMGGKDGMGEGGMEMMGKNMQPAASVDEALQIARDLLANEAQAKPDQNEMWNRVQRDRALEQQPGGPMMGKMG